MYRRLKHNIDLLIFNPPYVPTYDQEARFAQGEKDIAGSWAGGIDGMTITNLVLDFLTVGHDDIETSNTLSYTHFF